MANPIIRGFSKLLQFSGRDTRGEFWPYAGAVFVLFFVTNFVVIASMMVGLLMDASAQAAMHPSAVAVTAPSSTDAYMVTETAGAEPPAVFKLFFAIYPVMITMVVLLLAAAVVRRLHDRGVAGFRGLLPVPFLAIGMMMMPIVMGVFTTGTPRFDLFGLLFVNNMLYIVALVALIVLLAQPGSTRANRHGEPRAATPIRPVEDWSTPG